MSGRDLCEKLHYIGMERNIRKIALNDKLASAEDIAILSCEEICSLVAEKYECVFSDSSHIGLVRHEDLDTYNELVKIVTR